MSKEDTNDNQLNNLQLAWHGPDEPSAFAEMSAKPAESWAWQVQCDQV
jgi:hypothetical protein